MLHGNEGDPRIPVDILLIDDGSLGIRVEDHGAGFVPEDIPDPDSQILCF